MMEWIKEVKPILDLLNGLTSPFLAIVVTYIAYQQWKTNDRKDRRESREIKVSIYKRVKSHLNCVNSTREIRRDLYEDFRQAYAEADFFLPKYTLEYLNNIDIHSRQWLLDKECLDCAASDADQKSIRSLEGDIERHADALQNYNSDLYKQFSKCIK